VLNALELKNAKCKICGNEPTIKESTNLYLDLTKIQDKLDKWVDESSEKGHWSHNSITTTKGWIKEGLKGRCITRDLKWGTPVPLEGFTDKVFYVWFDAPIGYISITNTFTEKWEEWWKNPDDVQLYQFMGKDNVPFHCVIFPSTLIATQKDWTLLHHINTTEYLNYESGKFSKTRGIGVFGDQAKATGIKSEVWRYYLLSIRPEHHDSVFNWDDFASKNNNELIANLGNFTNRVLKYVFKNFEAAIPERKSELTEVDTKFLNNVIEKLEAYFNSMEAVKLKESLNIAMSISSLCNGYFQETEPFKIFTTEYERCCTILNVASNVLRLLCCILEPFIPSFCAKIYEQLNIQRTERDERLLSEIRGKPISVILDLIKPGYKINEPNPVFKSISDEDCQKWREQFSGK
jgi:methionyl-tRNA synthetase